MGSITHSISLMILAICCCYLSLNHITVAAATSTLNQGDRLNSSSTLVSELGSFTLGFFSAAPNFSNYYLGIRNTNDVTEVYWVANPDTPVDDSGELTIDSSGTLKIIKGGNTLFSLSDQVGSGNTRAVLGDNGNFVLFDVIRNRVFWESFDHPTNTLLPGMKLGFNLTTAKNWTLTSWLTDDIPATGAFTLSLERFQDSGQLVVRMRGKIYWESGPWSWTNNNFEFLPQLNDSTKEFPNNLSLVSDKDGNGMYFSFHPIGTSLSIIQLSPIGQILDILNRMTRSGYKDFCYGYESHNGCVTSTLSNCRGNKDSFELRSGDFIGSSGYPYKSNELVSLSDCMERCWHYCNCSGFAASSNGFGCLLWGRDLPFQQDLSGQTMKKYILVTQKSPKSKAWIWVVVALAIVVALLLAILVCYLKIRRRRLAEEEQKKTDEYIKQLTASDSFNNAQVMEKSARDAPDLKIFSFGAVAAATNNFSGENKLGEGGFGPVYRGKLLDGRKIAVKRLSKASGQGLEEFKNELILISKLQHTNLVRVLGCCICKEEKMLIYEYMRNKSLDIFLFSPDKKELLDWQKRLNIIEGVAQGLLYLHKYSRMKVIHRDLKASNVLLDDNMNPKISDFGMARIFKQDETEVVTKRVVGTLGYMPPEYAVEGIFSFKSDVFSFGVLVLEIVTGRKNSSFYQLDHPLTLIGYAWELWKEGMALDLKDPTLGESCDAKQLLRAIHVGLSCVQENAMDRPTMAEVISMLTNETMDLLPLKQPAFFTGRNTLEISSSGTASRDHLPVSVNGLSISMMEAR